MRLAHEIEVEREKLAQEAANPNSVEREEPMGLSQSSVTIPESKSDITSHDLPLESSASVEHVEAPLEVEVEPVVEVAQDGVDDVKMEG